MRRETGQVLAYDLGGTKVAVGIVTAKGRVLSERRVPVVISEGKKAVLKQLVELGREQLAKFPGTRRAGIASAGPLDPATGMLLDPTNFISRKEGSWGPTPLGAILSKSLGIPVAIDNDAAAAMLAEHWLGAAKGYDNAAILTLGTGLGTGFIANGQLVRAGRGLHPEAGHLVLREGDKHARCGCGNLGCAEAYLSGNGFARWVNACTGGGAKLSSGEIADAARGGEKWARAAFDEYADLMATLIQDLVVLYAPEIVVLTGGFAAAHDLFLPRTRKRLEKLLARRREGVDLLPKLALSALDNRAGLLGGAVVGLKA